MKTIENNSSKYEPLIKQQKYLGSNNNLNFDLLKFFAV